MGIGSAAGMVGAYVECLNEWARWLLALQELRRRECAGSAWLEVTKLDQVRHGGTALRRVRWVHAVGQDGSTADCIDASPTPSLP